MANDNRINPECVKAAAVMAVPAVDWRISHTGRVVTGKTAGIWWPGERPDVVHFDLFNSADDREALMLALMKEGWHFSWNESFDFSASNLSKGFSHEMNESFPLLLLKCVAAVRGMEVFV